MIILKRMKVLYIGRPIFCRWILTAAHCVLGREWNELKVILGDYDVSKKERQEITINVCGKIVHHDYKSNGPTLNDIALLRLCKNVRLTAAIQPITLAYKDMDLRPLSKVTVAGWGRVKFQGNVARVLRKVTLQTIENSICKNIYRNVTDGEICAGYTDLGGKDACQGDSGGPLWYKDNGVDYQIGIVSYGNGCARPDSPGVYTNIAHYRNWIETHMTHKLNQTFLSALPIGLANEFGALNFPISPLLPSEYKDSMEQERNE